MLSRTAGRGPAAPGTVGSARRLASVIGALSLALVKRSVAAVRAAERLAHSRRARWSQTCVSWLVWLAAACGSAAAAAAWLLRLGWRDPQLFAPASPGAGTGPLSPPVPPSWVSPPSPLLRAALAAPAGTRGVPPTWWAGKKGIPLPRWVLARGALSPSFSGRLPAAPAGEGNANPSISGS